MRSTALPDARRPAPARLLLSVLAVIALAFAMFSLAPAPTAQAHGWISDPPSRQDLCYTGAVKDCGPVQYEPWSVEAKKGSMLCSGGGRFTELDNESRAWPRQNLTTNETFTWDIVANHSTSTWEYFVDGRLHTTINDNGAMPPKRFTHTINNLPEGNHKIFVRWNIADTVNAFYQCIDAYITPGGNPAPEPPPVTTTPAPPPVTTTPAPQPGNSSCTATVRAANSWGSGFQGEVTVKAGSAAITSWKVTVSGATITQAWSSTLSGSDTLANAEWNGRLGAGASTTAGFIASGSGSNLSATCTAS
ncbi:lytic polysaccharide monooxygenase [Cellulomonas xiejunii]|uniref:Cellulose binding domain-containing protein n=1 Tax=Cellulomonas xiejunii TaxID=2968083 RepID=A0ABY5KT29_9CELL|nr:lytic polysaccharide monooxygenase [Cellulomonas xiejunii]MCC2322227.1 cellulose binding domain-containing protein [Cellulomonas xiejunii]UUI72280.1 cellulose binding domain-containing protein [Cellulomonas xiejunii]